jgi:transcriptional regulator with XRE-family HTH domain
MATQDEVDEDRHDLEIGARLRALRMGAGLSQAQLAARVGVTFQQLQKYERGANRIAASRLIRIAKALDVTPAQFFTTSENDGTANLSDPDVLMLMRSFASIRHRDLRTQVIGLVRSLAEAEEGRKS